MTDATLDFTAADKAVSLQTTLLAGSSYAFPTVDWSGADYALPSSSGNPLYTAITRISEDTVTSRKVDGPGVFDGFMSAIGAHLKGEWQSGRISGGDYAKVYIEAMSMALQQAVAFLTSREAAYWQSLLMQSQARAAEIDAVTAKVNLKLAQYKGSLARWEGAKLESETALTKLKLSTENVAYSVAQAQYDRITVEKDTAAYNLANILPAQKIGLEKDNDTKAYTLSYILPANLVGIQEQNESNRAKTLDTRSDGTTPVTGYIGRQKALLDQQRQSYTRADEAKVAKMFLDQWLTRKSVDEGTTVPSSLTDANMDEVFTAVRDNLNI